MKYFCIAVISLFCLGCQSTPTATYDYDKETNFTSFTSFKLALLPTTKDPDQNPIFNKKVAEEVTKQLSEKQLKKVDQDEDISVSVSIKYTNEESNSSFSFGIGGSTFGRRSSTGISIGTSVPIENSNKFAHIIIDMSHNGQPIWHGRDKFEQKEKATTEQQKQLITKTVQQILANYPPIKKEK